MDARRFEVVEGGNVVFQSRHEKTVRAFLGCRGKHLLVRVVFDDLAESLGVAGFPYNGDLRERIVQMLRDNPLRSSNSIRKELGCSEYLVRRIRAEIGQNTSRRIGTNGKVYQLTDDQRAKHLTQRIDTQLEKLSRDVVSKVAVAPAPAANIVLGGLETAERGAGYWKKSSRVSENKG